MLEKGFAQKIVEMFNTGNLDLAKEVFSENYVDHQKPDFISFDGYQEFQEIIKLARKSLPELKVIIEDEIYIENKFVLRLSWKSFNSDTNKEMNRETIEILRLENGKIVEHWGGESSPNK